MESRDMMLAGVSAVGFISLCCHLFAFFGWLYKTFIRAPKDLLDYGSWAIVTGSTDGIGKALAFELASRGLNLVCVGRNSTKLESTAAEIHRKFGPGIMIRNLTLDFDKSSPHEILSTVDRGIRGLDVGLLVNNAGIAYSHPRFLHETEKELIEAVIRVNVEAAVWMTRAVIPGMMKKKKGAIVNIGSSAPVATPSFPLYALYAASKAFMATFSRSIGLEYQDHRIDIQCQAPMFVSTKMTELGTNIAVASPETYARSSVRWMGYDAHCCPLWYHSVQSYIVQSIPDALTNWYLLQLILGMRRAALENKKMWHWKRFLLVEDGRAHP